ncbi:unnamed protein product (macronuclear) [Paramecium tetraurelia]|uniref:Uncharacterized protein n=1 Tax=Paramecium tetraurelia TaxID=5888 RepID=A0EF49_PARTE|nr:uncharacterized protein GSPATT00026263001 [Paramecium tetraurelia]CAK93940.1 unnamed protein product [Paramecium tetraurelia]|eukprot:XP_001461313.1 hypothetical protein (macronuclear) [Paramecium tetraurelia strain d4-2]
MTQQRPPIPKFNVDFLTHKVETTLLEEVQHLIFKLNLDFEIEKKAIRIIKQTPLPNNQTAARGVILYCLKEFGKKLPKVDTKLEQIIKYIEKQQASNFTFVCKKLGFCDQVSEICVILKKQLNYLIGRLEQNLQVALTVKIAADIFFLQYGGLNTRILSEITQVNEEKLKSSLNRITPFSEKIISDLINHYNETLL